MLEALEDLGAGPPEHPRPASWSYSGMASVARARLCCATLRDVTPCPLEACSMSTANPTARGGPMDEMLFGHPKGLFVLFQIGRAHV